MYRWLLLILSLSLPLLHGDEAMHALNRLAYGPRPGDLEAVRSKGVQQWVEDQLHPERMELPLSLKQQLDELATLSLTTDQLYERFAPRPGSIMTNDSGCQKVFVEACEARLLRALESPQQLYEIMVDFWFNHFNISADKGFTRLWIGAFERDAIRPHAMGNFLDLLMATAQHPAMLYFYDNWQSQVANTSKKQSIKEDYARALLQYQTLGEGGGYTEQDVNALARILTGWGFSLKNLPRHPAGTFWFNEQDHDAASKMFLGRPLLTRGFAEGKEALQRLAAHPSTAKHIALKLARYFVADDPQPQLVKQLADRFTETNGDIKEVLRTLFAQRAFWEAGQQFKNPYRLVASATRATGVATRNVSPLVNELALLDMPLYNAPAGGFDFASEKWMTSDRFLNRLSFMDRLTTGRLGALVTKADALVIENTLEGLYSPATIETVKQAREKERAGMLLGAPEFMRY